MEKREAALAFLMSRKDRAYTVWKGWSITDLSKKATLKAVLDAQKEGTVEEYELLNFVLPTMEKEKALLASSGPSSASQTGESSGSGTAGSLPGTANQAEKRRRSNARRGKGNPLQRRGSSSEQVLTGHLAPCDAAQGAPGHSGSLHPNPNGLGLVSDYDIALDVTAPIDWAIGQTDNPPAEDSPIEEKPFIVVNGQQIEYGGPSRWPEGTLTQFRAGLNLHRSLEVAEVQGPAAETQPEPNVADQKAPEAEEHAPVVASHEPVQVKSAWNLELLGSPKPITVEPAVPAVPLWIPQPNSSKPAPTKPQIGKPKQEVVPPNPPKPKVFDEDGFEIVSAKKAAPKMLQAPKVYKELPEPAKQKVVEVVVLEEEAPSGEGAKEQSDNQQPVKRKRSSRVKRIKKQLKKEKKAEKARKAKIEMKIKKKKAKTAKKAVVVVQNPVQLPEPKPVAKEEKVKVSVKYVGPSSSQSKVPIEFQVSRVLTAKEAMNQFLLFKKIAELENFAAKQKAKAELAKNSTKTGKK